MKRQIALAGLCVVALWATVSVIFDVIAITLAEAMEDDDR